MSEKEQDPFDPYVQELQGQEGAIERKLKIINELVGNNVGLTDEAKELLDGAKSRFPGIQEKILQKKTEDLDKELTELDELIEHPENFTPPPPQQPIGPQPPWWPPFWPWPPGGGAGSSSSSSSSSASGAVSGDDQTPPSAATVTLGTKDRDFIVARSKTKVWVWHPGDLKWVAELDAGDEIVEMTKVDGSVAVRTANALWLFNPLRYSWMGPLSAEVEEVTAYTLAVPAPVKKE